MSLGRQRSVVSEEPWDTIVVGQEYDQVSFFQRYFSWLYCTDTT